MSSPIYIAAGFKNDVSSILENVSNIGSFKFPDFSRCWKEKQFSLVFSGKSLRREQQQFVEEVFIIVIEEFKASEEDFQRQAGCLFLLYGLFMKQPLKPKVSISVPLRTLQDIERLVSYAKSSHHIDVLVVWKKLLESGGIHLTHLARRVGPSYMHRNVPLDNVMSVNEQAKNLKDSFSPAFTSLSNLHQQYTGILGSQDNSEALELVGDNDNIFVDLQKMLDDFSSCHLKVKADVGSDDESIGSKRRRLKFRRTSKNAEK
ncbi:snRNA-activating protein complex subunit 1 [Halotydeus destructor]|nr:snRNA-activating protein complex subunit 1 [Halotydeus destructor]